MIAQGIRRLTVTLVGCAGLAFTPLVTASAGAVTHGSAGAAAVPKCASGDLGVWVAADRIGMAAGTWYMPLEFTNLGHRTCTLRGFPGVSAISSSGRQLGDAAAWDRSVKPTTVTLPPGATASATLMYSNALTGSCPPGKGVAAFELRVYPPDGFGADHALWSLPTCTATGYTHFLQVLPIAAGTGGSLR
ncbi:MAG TPA: DUF4232 domain-containing protein [Actinospica sp.]|nr:DUF4232 domain-containing protein [Actinospica sp.]